MDNTFDPPSHFWGDSLDITGEAQDLTGTIQSWKVFKPNESTQNSNDKDDSIWKATNTAPIMRDSRYARELLRPDHRKPFLKGMVHPGLIDAGSLLGVGAWNGLPHYHQTKTKFAQDPSSAADIIVSILHQYSPEVLSDFFTCSTFSYVHHYEGTNQRAIPAGFERFAIKRAGSRIEAGFLMHFDGVDDTTEYLWNSHVGYELDSWGSLIPWRQAFMSRPNEIGETHRCTYLPETASQEQRQVWEEEAVGILASALTHRRWTERSGVFRIEVSIVPVTPQHNHPARFEAHRGIDTGASSSDDVLDLFVQNQSEDDLFNEIFYRANDRSYIWTDSDRIRQARLLVQPLTFGFDASSGSKIIDTGRVRKLEQGDHEGGARFVPMECDDSGSEGTKSAAYMATRSSDILTPLTSNSEGYHGEKITPGPFPSSGGTGQIYEDTEDVSMSGYGLDCEL